MTLSKSYKLYSKASLAVLLKLDALMKTKD
jgi:hypothetical protein